MKTKTILIIAGLSLGIASTKAQSTTASNTLSGTLPASPTQFIGSANVADVLFRSSGTNRMRITSGGIVVINSVTGTAGSLLDVNGRICLRGASAPVAGSVLSCINANGLAQWSSSAPWFTNGNAVTGVEFIGTTTNFPFRVRVNNIPSGIIDNGLNNAFWGFQSGLVTTGFNNVAMGSNSLFTNTSGTDNTAIGFGAMLLNTTASRNTVIGSEALTNNTTGSNNVAVGYKTLNASSNGSSNTAVGHVALTMNSTGSGNTAIGEQALMANTTGFGNSAIGLSSMLSNTTGLGNTASGSSALASNLTGNSNTASGRDALLLNSIGNNNVAVGFMALNDSKSSDNNVAIGFMAGASSDIPSPLNVNSNNVFVGANSGGSSMVTGIDNTFIGAGAIANANHINSAAFGSNAIATASDIYTFGSPAVLGLETTVGMFATSDGRFKVNVNENVKGLEFINKLRPVTYNLDTKALDDFIIQNMSEEDKQAHQKSLNFEASKAAIHSGFIAQEVEKTAQELGFNSSIVKKPSSSSESYALNYAELVVPLVKAVQEQQAMIEEQKKLIFDLQAQMSSSAGLKLNDSKEAVSMDQNIPNPFVDATDIKYEIPSSTQKATLIVYDLTGKQLQSFPLEKRGKASITISSEQFVAGIYVYAITADGKILESKKMMVSEKQ